MRKVRKTRKVLITGGSRGIGCEAVRMFSQEGYEVAFSYLNSEREARALAEETNALAFCLDVSDHDGVQKAIGALGPVDVLINNAGIAQSKLFQDISQTEWNRMMAVNAGGVFSCTQAVLPGMLHNKWGRIINVSSIWGISGAACEVHYSASKAAVIGLTRALAKELGPSGITVNCLAPGIIETTMNQDISLEVMAQLKEATPLGRFGSPKEVAYGMLFLASEPAGFITGQVLPIDGGFIN